MVSSRVRNERSIASRIMAPSLGTTNRQPACWEQSDLPGSDQSEGTLRCSTGCDKEKVLRAYGLGAERRRLFRAA